MIEYIKGSIERSYFIQKLTNQFDPEWFKFAYENGLLSFNKIPPPIPFTTNKGEISFQYKSWEGAFLIQSAAGYVEQFPEIHTLVVQIINGYIVFSYVQENSLDRNFTVDYQISRSILSLPPDSIDNIHIKFLFDFGLKRERSILSHDICEIFFFKLLDSNSLLASKLLDLLFTPLPEKKNYRSRAIVDEYTLENFSTSAPSKLFKKFDTTVLEWAIAKIEDVARESPLDFSKLHMASIEPDRQNIDESAFNFSIIRLLVGLLEEVPPDEMSSKISTLILNELPILRRIAYYFIDRRFEQLSPIFWEQANPLDDRNTMLEVYRLINRNCFKFEIEQVHQLLSWIKGLTVERRSEDKEKDYPARRAYFELEWHMALEPIRYRYPDLLIKDYHALKEMTNGVVPSHPGYVSYFSMSSGDDYSTDERILEKPPLEVLNILADKQRWSGYNTYGLQNDLTAYVIDQYDLISPVLYEFVALPVRFIYSFMSGLRSVIEKSTSLIAGEVLPFIDTILEKRHDLWDVTSDEREKSNAVGMIASLINSVFENKECKLTGEHISSAIEILIKLETNYIIEFEWLNNDPIMDITNSTRGKIYDALINASIKRVGLQNGPPAWDQSVKSLFTERLVSSCKIAEFYWCLGFYIPQISYLDMDWLKMNRHEMLKYREGKYKNPVFYGYLLFSQQLYKNLYDLLRDEYERQLSTLTDDNLITRRFVEHIWIAYTIDLQGANKLLTELISMGNERQIASLIDRIKIEDHISKAQKIRYVWELVLVLAEGSSNTTLREKVYEMVYFAEIINNFGDADLPIFYRTLRLGKQSLNTYRLLKIIEAKVAVGETKLAGTLLQMLLENCSQEAYFDEMKLIEILKELYENNLKAIADTIAIMAVERKNFGVVSVYNSFHNLL
ncbi:hypothetical protein [Sphingobacterium bambusae]|uniref:Uncharacterized protein n=1 Tax=Sphingobacterium bambusae TaxID=662858 RepID=A0ABW6BCR8_9SPHI|nr:hypothetical protein [Sphingobacterium bambusae]WPL48551.1 hypothetical protein SCB77_21620 [Sphingobacterium bambusae]